MAAWGATGIGTGVTFGTADVVEAAVVCGLGVTVIADAIGTGGMGCAGLVGADCGADTQGLAGACRVAVVASGTASADLTLHSHWCHLVWW